MLMLWAEDGLTVGEISNPHGPPPCSSAWKPSACSVIRAKPGRHCPPSLPVATSTCVCTSPSDPYCSSTACRQPGAGGAASIGWAEATPEVTAKRPRKSPTQGRAFFSYRRGQNYFLARPLYEPPSRVSISIMSSISMKSATCSSVPLASLAGFMTLPEVSPRAEPSV
jgi:hypothetical protein